VLIATVANSDEIVGDDDSDDVEDPTVHTLHELRRELLTRNPELFALRMASMHQFERELCDVVRRRLETDHRKAREARAASDSSDGQVPAATVGAVPAENADQRARLITYIGFAAMRHAWACWADAGGAGPLGDRLRDSFEELRATLAADALRELQPA
jgi:hypothetical protein